MTATTAQTAQASAQAAVQIGKGKEEANSNGFANLLADTISKSTKGVKVPAATPMLDIPVDAKKAPGQIIGEHAKGKGLKEELDLSVLGEIEAETVDGKKNTVKLADILAELSHKSEAPMGSEVINLKTVLGSKNDDPDLINKDLLGLVPAKDREKVMAALIGGAKQLLSEQLESRIPKNRVPKTLKGLLETAIRFNMVVSDIKLESLPATKVTKDLLKALEVKSKQESSLPLLGAKLPIDDSKAADAKTIKAADIKTTKAADTKIIKAADTKTTKAVVSGKSPLEQMLKAQEPKALAVEESAKVATVQETEKTTKEQPLAKSMKTATTATVATAAQPKEKEKTKVDSKETPRLKAKEAVGAEALKTAPVLNSTQVTQKGSALEKLLAVDGQESASTEAKSSQETVQQNVATKQDIAGVKSETPIGVKMAEARQLVSQLSADVKEAMESYKPPFTKLSMKLNPERLGEIDVMMVQRGNNVHINLTSNGAALGMLQQNSADLKAALANAGLGDATMNFSSNGESRNPSQDQQQKHSTSEHYAEMSKILEDIDSLELVVPRYV